MDLKTFLQNLFYIMCTSFIILLFLFFYFVLLFVALIPFHPLSLWFFCCPFIAADDTLCVEFFIFGLVLLTRLSLILPRCLFGPLLLRLSKLNSSSKGATWLIIKHQVGLWGRTELAACISSACVATLLRANSSAKIIVLVLCQN